MDGLVRRPLAVLGAAFTAGALVEAALPEGRGVAAVALVAGVVAVAFAAVPSAHRLFWLGVAAFALGCGWTRWRLPDLPANLRAPFVGIVAAPPTLTEQGYRLILQVGDGQFAQLSVPAFEVPSWRVGDVVRVDKFWGGVTRWRKQRFQRVFWSGHTEPDGITYLRHRPDAFAAQRWRERWRRFVFERWRQSLPERERTVTLSALASIVFGMRTAAVSEADERAFARSGLAHLFVPSGSQVTLLMGIAWFAHRALGAPPLPLLLLLLGFYLPLTQGEPSIFRAVAMGLYAFVGWRLYRDVDWQTALWVSSALLVAVEPAMLHDVGFQLSYAATFGLIYASPVLMRALHWCPEWLRFSVAASLSAQLFLAPVLAHYFGRVSVIAPVANFCALAPASFALTVGLLSAVLSLLSPTVAMPFSWAAGEAAKWVMQVAHHFAAPAWAVVPVTLSAWHSFAALTLLTALTAWFRSTQGHPAATPSSLPSPLAPQMRG